MDAPPVNRFDPWRRRLHYFSILARRALPVFSGVAMTLLTLFLYNVFFPPPGSLSLREVDIAVDEAIAEITPMPAFSSYAYQVIRPSLVLVQVATPPNADDEESGENGGGLGSGVVIDDMGSILTSLHVAFAGFAEMVQPPTAGKEVRADTIQSLLTGRRTAVGSAILKSIDAIAEVDPTVQRSTRSSADPAVTPVVAGAYTPNIIVLLTDGASNAGAEP